MYKILYFVYTLQLCLHRLLLSTVVQRFGRQHLHLDFRFSVPTVVTLLCVNAEIYAPTHGILL